MENEHHNLKLWSYFETNSNFYLVVGGFGVSLNLGADVKGGANHTCHVICRKAHRRVREECLHSKECFLNHFYLLGLIWASILCCALPLHIYLQPE